MYLPRALISHLYSQLIRSHHPLSPPVLILVALEPDALCACRIFTQLLKRDYIPHKIKPIAGYGDLTRAGQELIQPMRYADGGSGGIVCCLGVGGLVDLEALLGLEIHDDGTGGADGVDVWVFDAHRPWNLANVFGGAPTIDAENHNERNIALKDLGIDQGVLSKSYKPSRGGIIVFDDGDIQEELGAERAAWYALEGMPDLDEDGVSESSEGDGEERIPSSFEPNSRKRKAGSEDEDDWSDNQDEIESRPPRQRRRSNSSSSLPESPSQPNRRSLTPSANDELPPSNQYQASSPPSRNQPESAAPTARQLRRRLLRIRRKHDATLAAYNSLGTSYSEPISSLMYSLASEMGREDNDLLWLAIVGVSSTELYGRTSTGVSLTNHDVPTSVFNGWTGTRGSRIRQLLRDEVRRLNPPELTESGREVMRGQASDAIPVHARSSTDNAIQLSPEPRFLLIRHWSLYDSMLHSPYLSAKLHIWSDNGRRRLHKLLAKMGVSLSQCKQSYTHMDMDLKRGLRERLLHFAPMYGLDGLVPPATSSRGGADKEGWGFVRTWGWKACLSAADVAVVIGAMLEIGHSASHDLRRNAQSLPTPPGSSPGHPAADPDAAEEEAVARANEDEAQRRFYAAYDALLSPSRLTSAIPLAQSLHRAILRTGTSLLQKRQIRHLRAFRLAVVKEGPDVALFAHAGALTKLALWIGEAVGEIDKDSGGSRRSKRGGTPLVIACADDTRGVYVVVGMGGGTSTGGVIDAEEQRARQERKAAREKRRREREERREAKRREREERDDDDDEALETEDESSQSEDSEDDEDEAELAQAAKRRGYGRNRFGNAFQEVVEETNARVRLDSFEHCVVEVKKEDLSGFLEGLSMKAVVG